MCYRWTDHPIKLYKQMTDSSPPPLLSIITTTDPAARQLPKLLDALSSLATQMSQSFEVIVIDDLKLWPSSDDCHLDTYPGLVIHPLWYPEYRGQLRAMLSGIMIAQGDSILTIDPDMHPCVPEIPGMQSTVQLTRRNQTPPMSNSNLLYGLNTLHYRKFNASFDTQDRNMFPVVPPLFFGLSKNKPNMAGLLCQKY